MAGGGELKLLSTWPSPFSIRVKMALSIKGLSYEYSEEDTSNKSELLLRSNPVQQKVPVLIHDGVPVCESLVIMEYLDEAFTGTGAGTGPSILPTHPYERAVARFWAAYVDDKVFGALVTVVFREGTTEEERSEGVKQMVAAVETLEGALAQCSDGRDFFGGESFGFVDLVLGSYLSWLKAVQAMSGQKILDASKTPLLAAWAERFGQLEVAKKALPDVGRVVEFAKQRRARLAAAAAAAASTN